MIYAAWYIGGVLSTFAASWLYNKMLDIHYRKLEDKDLLTEYFKQLEADGE